MRRQLTFPKTAASVALAATCVVASGVPAQAATPQVTHTKIRLTLSDDVLCGLTMTSVVRGVRTSKVTTDRSGVTSYQTTGHVVRTMTNPANGKVIHIASSGRDASSDGVVNPDGTTTYTSTLTGTPLRIYTSRNVTLVKDVGFTSIRDTVDAEGNVIDSQVVHHGQRRGAGDPGAMCDAVLAAIG